MNYTLSSNWNYSEISTEKYLVQLFVGHFHSIYYLFWERAFVQIWREMCLDTRRMRPGAYGHGQSYLRYGGNNLPTICSTIFTQPNMSQTKIVFIHVVHIVGDHFLTSTGKTKVANSILLLLSTYRQNAQKRLGMNQRHTLIKLSVWRDQSPIPRCSFCTIPLIPMCYKSVTDVIYITARCRCPCAQCNVQWAIEGKIALCLDVQPPILTSVPIHAGFPIYLR